MKDWAKPPSDHVDPYHLGIRFVGFLTTNFSSGFDLRIVLLGQFTDHIGWKVVLIAGFQIEKSGDSLFSDQRI